MLKNFKPLQPGLPASLKILTQLNTRIYAGIVGRMMPKERPILFNSEMIRAVLDGRKTQTRRVIKDVPYDYGGPAVKNGICTFSTDSRGSGTRKEGDAIFVDTKEINCPYGQPGDRLWVRETLFWEQEDGWCYRAGGQSIYGYDPKPTDEQVDSICRNRLVIPSIHIPRWASRITLEVTGVRVERVQDISGEDAKKEGWPRDRELFPTVNGEDKARRWFQILWDSINKSRGFDWDVVNPWVWVIEFKKLEAKNV